MRSRVAGVPIGEEHPISDGRRYRGLSLGVLALGVAAVFCFPVVADDAPLRDKTLVAWASPASLVVRVVGLWAWKMMPSNPY